jgi:translation initiation factor RLI1
VSDSKKKFSVLVLESDIAYLDYVAEEMNITRGKLIRIAIDNEVRKLKNIYGKPLPTLTNKQHP